MGLALFACAQTPSSSEPPVDISATVAAQVQATVAAITAATPTASPVVAGPVETPAARARANVTVSTSNQAAVTPIVPGAPTPIVARAPTPIVAGASASLRDLLDARFDAIAGGWPNDPNGTFWFAEGGCRLLARRPGAFVAVRAPLGTLPADVVVSGTFRKVGGPPGGGYGLIVRDQQTNSGDGVDQSGRYVVAEVGDGGEFGVWRREEDHWVDLVPWTHSDAVRTGGSPNELRVQVSGDQLTFSANGAQLGTTTVRFLNGGVGLFTGGDRNEVLIDRFRVQAIQTASPPRGP